MIPHRIQRKRNKGWRNPEEGIVFTGRPTKWGNPFIVGAIHTQPNGQSIILDAKKAVSLYIRSVELHSYPVSKEEIQRELKGKTLSCWCPIGQPCHADYLLSVANKKPPTQ